MQLEWQGTTIRGQLTVAPLKQISAQRVNASQRSIRGQLTAAPLKRVHPDDHLVAAIIYPRSIDCGPIEAAGGSVAVIVPEMLSAVN